MEELAERVLEKLESMSDEEFAQRGRKEWLFMLD